MRPRAARGVGALTALALVALLGARSAVAVQLEALDPGREWRLAALAFEGNGALSDAQLGKAMVTKARPWYEVWRFWRPLPPFDPITFRSDLERLRQLHRNHGYYHALVHHDIELPAKGNAVRAVVWVREGPPVYVEEVCVELGGVQLPDDERRLLLAHLPVERGQIFTADDYQRGVTYLRAYYREHGFARVQVSRGAEVDVRRDAATVRYVLDSGPPSVFGAVRISGAPTVGEDVVQREIAFRPAEPFKQSLLDQTRQNLLALRLFRSIRIDEDEGRDPRVDVHVRLVEGPSHEVRFGVGYETEDQLRGLASWRDYDFLGGARQLGFSARASFLRRTIAADFLQPHFPGRNDRVRLLLAEQQEIEDTYTNDRSRLTPRIEWQPLPGLTPYLFYRIEYDSLSDVSDLITILYPDIAPANGILSGFGLGLDWNATDDLLDPMRGWVANASVEPVGGILGGDFSFLRLSVEGRRYQPLVGKLSSAIRLHLGAADPIAGGREVPLFERFYAGGLTSVRGYDRRRVGPLVDDEPIGGRTLVEGSVELRHPITDKLGGAVFLDAGQVSLRSYEFPFRHLRYGTGLGVRYHTPVGPLRLDLGFPVQGPRGGDPPWQVHVSIGQAF